MKQFHFLYLLGFIVSIEGLYKGSPVLMKDATTTLVQELNGREGEICCHLRGYFEVFEVEAIKKMKQFFLVSKRWIFESESCKNNGMHLSDTPTF
jgi:hypothetical protein